MIPQTKLSDAFRRERARRGLSLRDAAAETGVYYTTLNRFENGIGKADMQTLVAIADWLDIDLLAKPIEVYPEKQPDAILDVIRADDNVTDKDALCDIFAAAYRGMVKI